MIKKHEHKQIIFFCLNIIHLNVTLLTCGTAKNYHIHAHVMADESASPEIEISSKCRLFEGLLSLYITRVDPASQPTLLLPEMCSP